MSKNSINTAKHRGTPQPFSGAAASLLNRLRLSPGGCALYAFFCVPSEPRISRLMMQFRNFLVVLG